MHCLQAWLCRESSRALQCLCLKRCPCCVPHSWEVPSLCGWLVQGNARSHLVETESFEHTFGPKARRRRPKLGASDYERLLESSEAQQGRGKEPCPWGSATLCAAFCSLVYLSVQPKSMGVQGQMEQEALAPSRLLAKVVVAVR